MALLTTGTLPGTAVTTATALPPMGRTVARTLPMAITPPQALTRAAHQPRRHMEAKRWDRLTTHTREPMAQRIKAPTPIRTGAARRPLRTARPWTPSITQARMEALGQPRLRAVTSMRPQTATPTRTLGVAGRRPVLLMLHAVGEAAAVDRTTTAADRRHSAAGAVTLVATPAGAPGLRAPAAGAAVAEVVAGVVEGFEAADSGARLQSIAVRNRDEPQPWED